MERIPSVNLEDFLSNNQERKQNFVNAIGKWSMADVMVVAIFMAFIGFRRIIESQLKGMENSNKFDEIKGCLLKK